MLKTDAAFWDSSALVPLLCRQEASTRVRSLARRYGRITAWWGTRVEVVGALARLEREGVLTQIGFRQTRERRMVRSLAAGVGS